MNRTEVPLDRVVEAAYADGDDETWLVRLVEATRPVLDAGLGVLGFFYDMSDVTAPTLRAPVMLGTPDGTREALERVLEHAPHALLRMLHRLVPSCTTMSDRLGLGAGVVELPLHRTTLAPLGISDFLAVAATDASGAGCLIGAPLAHVTPPEAIDTATLTALSAHVTAGMRTRIRRRSAIPASEEAAAPIWAAVVAGQWTVVDSFDRAGARFLLAKQQRSEASAAAGESELTAREEEVGARAAMGHSNKKIALDLGVAPSTVAGHLANAAKKLGARSRAELMRAFVRRRLP